MSYSISPIITLGVRLGKEYFDCLKKDLKCTEDTSNYLSREMYRSDSSFEHDIRRCQLHLFDELIGDRNSIVYTESNDYYNNFFQEKMYSDNNYQRYDGGKNSENYAHYCKVNIDTGSYEGFEVFDGYVYEFSWGSNNVYKPEFKNKTDLLNEIRKNLYIPTHFDLENNIILITAVCGG